SESGRSESGRSESGRSERTDRPARPARNRTRTRGGQAADTAGAQPPTSGDATAGPPRRRRRRRPAGSGTPSAE
ncbi:MAG: DEAD/DEAH box helicase, partial [Jatrophihabitantaceae bacterium]